MRTEFPLVNIQYKAFLLIPSFLRVLLIILKTVLDVLVAFDTSDFQETGAYIPSPDSEAVKRVQTVAAPPICRTLQWTCPSRARTETQLWPEQGLVSCFVPEDLEQDQEQSNSYHLTAKPCTNLGTIVSLIARDLWMGTKYCRISAKISPGAPLSHSSSLTRGDVDSDRPDRITLSCDFFFPFFFFFS